MSLYHPTNGYISIYNLQQNGKKTANLKNLLLQEPTVPNVLQGISLTFAVLLGHLEMFTLPTLPMPMKKRVHPVYRFMCF